MQLFNKSTNYCTGIELVNSALSPLKIFTIYSASGGRLFPMQGFGKVSDTILEQMHLTYQIESLPEAEIPLISPSDSEIIQMKKTSDFFWKSNHYRFEILISFDRGKNWVFRNALPLKRAAGFPVQTVRLLDLISDTDIFRMQSGMLIGCRFRDVGYGIPKATFDSMIIHSQGVCDETLYEKDIKTILSSTATYVTERQPASGGNFALLIATRVNRKTLTFSATGAANISFEIKYGLPLETGTLFTIKVGETLTGLNNYTGEISFRQVTTGAITTSRVQVVEVVG